MEVGLVALWLVGLLALGGAALPLSTWLFAGLRPAAFAVPVALAVLAVVGHLVGHLAFGWPALAAGLVALAGLSLVAARVVETDHREALEPAAVFGVAFLCVVLIRAVDPAAAPLPVAVGEKFLDFGLLKSLERTEALPPEDVWFAGRPVVYYYGGHMLSALLGTLSGTAPRFAYNLALAGFYAALVTGVYGLAGSIATTAGHRRRPAAALGAFFVGVAGNLETALRVLVWLAPGPVEGWVIAATGLGPGAAEWTPDRFFYFDASRVVPVDPRAPDAGLAATEFPLFAWLNGDLHAHMMSQPFLVLSAALALSYWRLPAGRRRKRAAVLFGALAPVAGLIGFVNLWSFPTVGGLVALTVWLAPAPPEDLLPGEWAEGWTGAAGWLVRGGLGLAVAAVVLAVGVLWTLPFWLGGLPGGSEAGIALWDARTPLGPLVTVHGAFLAVFGLALATRAASASREPRRRLGWVIVALALAVGAGTVAGFPALGLVAPLLLGGWWYCRRDGEFAWLLVVAGGGLVLVVELATVSGERFNSIFKPYAHVWLFWAVAAGVLLARLIEPGGRSVTPPDALGDRRTIGRALAAVLVASTGLYAGFALPAHVGNPGPAVAATGPTLDATAYVETEYPAEAPAIRWLDAREGQPTITTAAPGDYVWRPADGRGASAPASLTGLPTVLGWFHEAQYRGSGPYERRLADVRAIYTGTEETRRRLLAAYGVEYVYVGPAERARYGEVRVGETPGVSVARTWENVTVYRVGLD